MIETPPTSPATPVPTVWWRAILDSVRGVHHDYTAGSLNRAIVLLAIPMVLEMLMESLFGLVDVFWVAHLGADAIATVGLTETGLTLVFVMAIGLSTGAAAVVSRRIGEKDEAGAGAAAIQAILMGLAISTIVAVVGFIYAPDLLRALGGSDSVVRTGSNYTRIIVSGSATVFLLFLINSVFRGAGDAAVAMRVLWLANIVNICLNPFLIFGWGPFPQMGVTGSAVGTTIGRGVGVLFQLYILFSGKGRITVRRDLIKIDTAVMATMFRLSLTAMFQYLVQMASWIGVVRIIAGFSSSAVAANTLAIKIVLFAILPSWGMSNAAATLVGQNLGAKKPERAEQAVWRTGLFNMLFLGAISVIFIAFADPIIGAFTTDPEVVPIAVSGLRILALGNVSYAYGMVLTAAFNGAGDAVTPTILNLVCFWAVQIPLAYYLAITLGMGPSGAWSAILVADTLLAVLAMVIFKRGKWKGTVV
ncbi:MAG: MATE family efflux transporter [Bryobacteraceae bacterium]